MTQNADLESKQKAIKWTQCTGVLGKTGGKKERKSIHQETSGTWYQCTFCQAFFSLVYERASKAGREGQLRDLGHFAALV